MSLKSYQPLTNCMIMNNQPISFHYIRCNSRRPNLTVKLYTVNIDQVLAHLLEESHEIYFWEIFESKLAIAYR